MKIGAALGRICLIGAAVAFTPFFIERRKDGMDLYALTWNAHSDTDRKSFELRPSSAADLKEAFGRIGTVIREKTAGENIENRNGGERGTPNSGTEE